MRLGNIVLLSHKRTIPELFGRKNFAKFYEKSVGRYSILSTVFLKINVSTLH